MRALATYFPTVKAVEAASEKLWEVALLTPLTPNVRYSEQFGCNILFKREDLQQVRSYKIRGAYNKMASLSELEIENGIVCASAGNHSQGVALSCKLLKIKGTIYMPAPTPKQKIGQVKIAHQFYAQQLGSTARNIGIAGKIAINLYGKQDGCQ